VCSCVPGSRERRHRAVVIAALLAACCGGCGGDAAAPTDAGADAPADARADASPDDASDAGVISAEEFIRARRRLQCEEVLRCESRYNADWLFSFETTCHPSYRSRYDRALSRAVAEGRAEFDPVAAQACLAGLAEIECFRGNAYYVPACSSVFTGLVPLGGECFIETSGTWLECAEGALCALRATCPGECVSEPIRGGAGDPCTYSFECDLTLFCRDGTCTPSAGEGEPCTSHEECGAGLICGPDGASATVCLDPHAVTSPGGPCIYAPGLDTCPIELVCICDGCMIAGTCVTTAPLGASCDTLTPCGRWARCVGGTCTPVAALEGDCSGGAVCPFTHWCDGARCRPLPIESQACSPEGCFHSVCLPEGICGFIGGRVGSGEVCDRVWQDCIDGLECRTGDDTMPRCYPVC